MTPDPPPAAARGIVRGQWSQRGGLQSETILELRAFAFYPSSLVLHSCLSMTSAASPDIQSSQSRFQPAPCENRFIEANGVRLHYLDYGTAGSTPMLCLHGGAVNAHWFDFVAAGFTADYHVRALDQRGHGDSAWAAAAGLQLRDATRQTWRRSWRSSICGISCWWAIRWAGWCRWSTRRTIPGG